MADQTKVSVSEVNAIGGRLRNLVPESMIAKYDKLGSTTFEAGPPTMDAAQWLEDRVVDRAVGFGEYFGYLRVVFTGLATAVERSAVVLSGQDADSADALGAVDRWVESVNGAEVPASTANLPTGKSGYDSGDSGGDPSLLWDIGPDGRHVPPDGKDGIVINLPERPDGLPFQDGFDEYGDVIKDAGGKDDDVPGFLFVPDGQEVMPTDPRDEPSGGGSGGGAPGEQSGPKTGGGRGSVNN